MRELHERDTGDGADTGTDSRPDVAVGQGGDSRRPAIAIVRDAATCHARWTGRSARLVRPPGLRPRPHRPQQRPRPRLTAVPRPVGSRWGPRFGTCARSGGSISTSNMWCCVLPSWSARRRRSRPNGTARGGV